ncbi:MAG: hypothetical protein GF383_16040 [Candidatus Lokiarchaeota archaeon]|nr:hypothetical protein [Candidatus Lokiarchaeota archaeon]MBD3343233.1 hypothetical protein [Candidatus Lokiarchaeota archaeon]
MYETYSNKGKIEEQKQIELIINLLFEIKDKNGNLVIYQFGDDLSFKDYEIILREDFSRALYLNKYLGFRWGSS